MGRIGCETCNSWESVGVFAVFPGAALSDSLVPVTQFHQKLNQRGPRTVRCCTVRCWTHIQHLKEINVWYRMCRGYRGCRGC